jgi:protocatechuate 3,4-dioxygenase beta subunit
MTRAVTTFWFVLVLAYAMPAIGDPITCTGTVVGADGKGLADVSVRLYDVTVGMEGFKAALAGETMTKSDGTFVLIHPRIDSGESACTGMILAGKGGLAIDWANWRYDADLSVEMALGEPLTLKGRVVDEGGKGIAGADVGAFLVAASRGAGQGTRVTYGLPPAEWLVTKTDEAGRFSFGNLPSGCTCELLAQAPGRARVFTLSEQAEGGKGQFTPGAEEVKIVLSPEAVIWGVVTDKETHEPISGMGVFVRSERASSYMESSPAASGSDGRFRFSALRPGNYQIGLVADGTSDSLWVAEPVYVGLGAGEVKGDLAFELHKAGVIEVLVTDAATHQPVAGASVWMVNEGNRQTVFGTTDMIGVARIVVPPGRYKGDSLRSGSERLCEFNQEASVAAGETCRLIAQLGQPLTVSGTVLDPNGKAVVNAEVGLFPGAERKTHTDPNGRFEIPVHRLPWQAESHGGMVLLVRHAKRNLATARKLEGNIQPAEVRLPPAAELVGKVLGQDGKPVSRASVSIELSLAGEEYATIDVVESGTDGRYRVDGIPSGQTYRISAQGISGFGNRQADVKVTKGHNGSLEVPDLVLPLANLSVAGAVVDEGGRAVAGAKVTSQGFGQPARHATSNSLGRFVLEGVCKGRIRLFAETAGPPRTQGGEICEVGSNDVTIVLRPVAQRRQTQPSERTSR